MKTTLRAVPTPAQVPPETVWLAISAEIDALEDRARKLRATRQALKAEIMSGLGSWGMSDAQVTAALSR